MNLSAEASQALESFEQARGWEQRARLLMQWGNRLEPLDETEKVNTTECTVVKAWCGWWPRWITTIGTSRRPVMRVCCEVCWRYC